jgi:hypothetical protein
VSEPPENGQRLQADASAERRPERPDPHGRPSDPAGTRPKVRPEDLRSSAEYRALPAGEPTAAVPAPQAAASPPARLVPPAAGAPPHAPRFQFIFGAFGALGLVAVVLAVALALAPKPKPGAPWSAWRPTGDIDPAVQIAEHVAPEYKLPNGRQLVNVTGGPQAIGGQPVVVALRTSGSAPAQLPENGVFYQLCGTGANCSIPGKASAARGLLVQREAVELALYTFRYVGGAEQVIVTYPPLPQAKTAKASSAAAEEAASVGSPPTRGRALLFRRADLAAELSHPLAATLPSAPPTVATIERAPESRLVNILTGRLLYNFDVIQQSTGLVFLLQSPSIG